MAKKKETKGLTGLKVKFVAELKKTDAAVLDVDKLLEAIRDTLAYGEDSFYLSDFLYFSEDADTWNELSMGNGEVYIELA